MPSFYEVLEIDPDALPDAVRAAYRRKLLECHPDKTGVSTSSVSVDAIKAAYDALSTEEARAKYDKELHESTKKQGFLISGEGLDAYTLELFEEVQSEDGLPLWVRDCPRCAAQDSFQLVEDDLERGTPDGCGGLQVLVPCLSCSLWITVVYEVLEE